MTWAAMLDVLAGRPAPALPALPGRRHECVDEALQLDDAELATLTPGELVRLHVGRSLAWAECEIHGARTRLQAHNTEGPRI